MLCILPTITRSMPPPGFNFATASPRYPPKPRSNPFAIFFGLRGREQAVAGALSEAPRRREGSMRVATDVLEFLRAPRRFAGTVSAEQVALWRQGLAFARQPAQ